MDEDILRGQVRRQRRDADLVAIEIELALRVGDALDREAARLDGGGHRGRHRPVEQVPPLRRIALRAIDILDADRHRARRGAAEPL